MSDYIEREEALRIIESCAGWSNPLEAAYEDIQALPAADVAPVRHGRWIKPVPGDGENYCSVCHAEQPWFYGYGYYEPDYCPSCGARMDKEADT